MPTSTNGSQAERMVNGKVNRPILHDVLLRLERVQREVGEIQSDLIRLLGLVASASPPAAEDGPPGLEPVDVVEGLDVGRSSSDELPPQCLHPAAWLAERGITVKRVAQASDLDPAFDELALFLGERFTTVQLLYDAIKRRVTGSPYPRSLKLTEQPAQACGDICTFARRLHANGFLSEYHYHKSTRTLVFDPQPDGRVTNFFTGGWLERYVLLTAVKHAEQRLPESLHPATLTQVVVELPDHQETELDVLLGLPDRMLWFECKTGDWQNHATKFGRVARHLGIPPRHTALVLLDRMGDTEKKSASVLSTMTAIHPEEMEAFIESALTAVPRATTVPPVPLPASKPPAASGTSAARPNSPFPAAEPSPSSAPSPARNYASWLSKRGLRPLEPGLRRQIQEDLVRLAAAHRVPLNELTKRLKADYDAAGRQVSTSQINNVATAARHAGLSELKAHADYPAGVHELRADVTADELWRRSSQLYLWNLLKNPAWPSDHHLDLREVALLLDDSAAPETNPAERLTPLFQTLAEEGRCTRRGTEWIAVGDRFDGTTNEVNGGEGNGSDGNGEPPE